MTWCVRPAKSVTTSKHFPHYTVLQLQTDAVLWHFSWLNFVCCICYQEYQNPRGNSQCLWSQLFNEYILCMVRLIFRPPGVFWFDYIIYGRSEMWPDVVATQQGSLFWFLHEQQIYFSLNAYTHLFKWLIIICCHIMMFISFFSMVLNTLMLWLI